MHNLNRIYVVEDEQEISDIINLYLEKNGFQVTSFQNGEEALKKLIEDPPDLALLDIMLPGRDGMEILRELRKVSNLPVIFLTSRKDELDKILGLEMGADDYIPKPFSPREMVARVKSLLRRMESYRAHEDKSNGNGNGNGNGTMEHTIKTRRLILDLDGMRLVTPTTSIKLTSTEFAMLRLFMNRQGRIYTRTELLELIWGTEFEGETRTVDVHVRNLRKKLQAAGGSIDSIQSIRGVGYSFED